MNEILITAVSLGFLHTITGPDHYIPFAVLAKANNWKDKKMYLITFICGLAHILSSIIIGGIGIALGLAVAPLEQVESQRGNIVTYMLIAFGLAYFIYGLTDAIRQKSHSHTHCHLDSGITHSHKHTHNEKSHIHLHCNSKKSVSIFWSMFIIFALGPCEILIPLLMYPASEHNYLALTQVCLVFSIATLATMFLGTFIVSKGFSFAKLEFKFIQKWSHCIAGLSIMLCGGLMILGL